MTTLAQALAARGWGYRPGALVVADDGRRLEAVSYPFPTCAGLWIMARSRSGEMPENYRLPDELLDFLNLETTEVAA